MEHLRRTNAPLIAALLLFVALTWPVNRWLWQEWLHNDYYSHGPLVLLVAVSLAWKLWPTASRPAPADRYGLLLLAAATVIFVATVWARAYYLSALLSILVLAGLVWTFGGLHLTQRLAFPLALLALTVPLPFIERATLPLALWTGVSSGALANLFGAQVIITGAAVTLPNAALTIGAQCSGINSILSLLTVTLLAAFLFPGPWWGRLALVLSAVPLAMLGNVFRVTSLMMVARQFGVDAAFTFYHDYSGPLFFILALVLLAPLLRVFQCTTPRPGVF